jgi:hypothetical protein
LLRPPPMVRAKTMLGVRGWTTLPERYWLVLYIIYYIE